MHKQGGKFLKLLNDKYKHDPVKFAKEIIGITLTPQQIIGLDALGRENGKSVAIKSGHKQHCVLSG